MRALLVGAVVLVTLSGCSEGDPGADGDVESLGALVPGPVAEELTRSGVCDDGLQWAADETGSLAVTVAVVGSGDEADLPSEDIVVTVLHGEDLERDVCDPEATVAARSPAAQGRVEVDGCAFRIDGLEAEDGTTFGPIETSCEAPVALTRSGGCGDAYLWAATDDGTVAITVSVDAIDRSSAEPTTIAIDLPQDDVEAFVLRGDRDMTGNFCTDLIDGDAEPDETVALIAGSGEVVLDPLPDEGDVDGCGDIAGRATLTGLRAEDGVPFAPVTIETTSIGCYAG